MGFSADQSMVLISKAMMDALEGRRADINNEKLALMREQETLALEYNDAMSNTCFVTKNPETGEYEAMAPEVSGNSMTFDGLRVDTDALSSEEKRALKNGDRADRELLFNQYYNAGKIDLEDPNNNYKQTSLDGRSGVSESYYTADDAAAKAEYDSAMAQIRTKETKLDMDLEQVETQYQAIKTQYESARQLVNQRAQSDFKFFQG